MNNKKRGLSAKGLPELPYADFIEEINRFPVEQYSDMDLKQSVRSLRALDSPCNSVPDEAGWKQAFALIKEIIYRLTGLRLFDTQLSAAVSMLHGRVAELPTGEGKTLAAVLPAAERALRGQAVHLLVFNDYLARRDHLLTKPLYDFLGLSSGFISQSMTAEERQKAYGCDIVYLCAKEAGFDYLRNFLCMEEEDMLCNRYDCAIVDEADSILIDEAKTPLVLAGAAPDAPCSLSAIARAVEGLGPADVGIDRAANQAYLTESGATRTETLLNLQNLYVEQNSSLLSQVNAALAARFLLVRDKDYLVKDDGIRIIDELTGRISENRKYPDLIHNAVEAKENLLPSGSSMIYNSMTIQSFLLQYKTLCGMTGTALTSAQELKGMYGLAVDTIPPHVPCIRVDHADVVCRSEESKFAEIVSEIKRAHSKGQPVLIGTQSVRESERLAGLLTATGIPCCALNAKNDEAEAELIAKAGEPGRVTVSTNMAGRGVDIRLGGDAAKQEQVRQAGGLYVIGTGLNRSVRVDNQLRGRAGRQGDAGESRFFASPEDSLFIRQGVQPGGASEPRLQKAIRKIQKAAEGEDAEARYMLERYAYILEEQRKIITDLRSGVLTCQKPMEILRRREPETRRALIEKAGEAAVNKVERQLTLYFINLHWAQYLESMEAVKDGIHLTLIGGHNPIDEYHRAAISAFDEMTEDIEKDVVNHLKTCKITSDGIEPQTVTPGGFATWTCQIDESAGQFSALPYLTGHLSTQIKGTVFSISGLFRRHRKSS